MLKISVRHSFKALTSFVAVAAIGACVVSASLPAAAQDVTAELKEIEANPAPGPNGEKPVLAADLKLTPQEIEKIKSMSATAAIVMHYTASDWAKVFG